MGTPLNLLLLSKKKFENVNDEKVEKLHKVSTFTFATWILISNTAFRKVMRTRDGKAIQDASLDCSHHHAQVNSDLDNDVTNSEAVHAVPGIPSDGISASTLTKSSTLSHSHTSSIEIIEQVDSPGISRLHYHAHSLFLPPNVDFSFDELKEVTVIKENSKMLFQSSNLS